MHMSSNETVKGRHILFTIGKINASSSWHAANGAPLEDDWRAIALKDLIRKAEEIDADAIVGIDYETDSIESIEAPNVRLKSIVIREKPSNCRVWPPRTGICQQICKKSIRDE